MIYKNIEKHGIFVIQIPPAPPKTKPIHPDGFYFYCNRDLKNFGETVRGLFLDGLLSGDTLIFFCRSKRKCKQIPPAPPNGKPGRMFVLPGFLLFFGDMRGFAELFGCFILERFCHGCGKNGNTIEEKLQ